MAHYERRDGTIIQMDRLSRKRGEGAPVRRLSPSERSEMVRLAYRDVQQTIAAHFKR